MLEFYKDKIDSIEYFRSLDRDILELKKELILIFEEGAEIAHELFEGKRVYFGAKSKVKLKEEILKLYKDGVRLKRFDSKRDAARKISEMIDKKVSPHRVGQIIKDA